MSGTTNISELPNQHSQNNVVLNVKEQQPIQQQVYTPQQQGQAPQNTMVQQPMIQQQQMLILEFMLE